MRESAYLARHWPPERYAAWQRGDPLPAAPYPENAPRGNVVAPKPAVAVPREKWPAWAAGLAKLAEPGEASVGDTAHRLTGTAGEAYMLLRKKLGIPCRCAQRRAEWNTLYPYTLEQPGTGQRPQPGGEQRHAGDGDKDADDQPPPNPG